MNADALPDLESALRLFDETVRALEARVRRLEEVLTLKQGELQEANRELALRLTEVDRLHASLDAVLRSVASGVIAVDGDGVITTANPAAEAMHGQVGGLVGRRHDACFADAPLAAVLAGQEPAATYQRRVGSGDGARLLRVTASPLRDAEGRVTGAVEACEDLTEVVALRERLERVERLRALGEMAAGVAHEIRNPLNGIEGFASLLQRETEPGTRSQQYARSIHEGVRHLNHTVSSLLEYTRQKPPSRRPVPPVELAASCCELVRAECANGPARVDGQAEIGNQSVAIELVDDWGPELVAVDGTQIRQVLLNLLQNAVQAVREHGCGPGRVRLGLARGDAGDLVIAVEDSGPGIPEGERGRIFTPFFTTRDRGTGLGLAIAHTIIDLHGGALIVDDSPELGGARLRLTLPVDEPAA